MTRNEHGSYEQHFEGHLLMQKAWGLWNSEGVTNSVENWKQQVLALNLKFWGFCNDFTAWEGTTPDAFSEAFDSLDWAKKHNCKFCGIAVSNKMFEQFLKSGLEDSFVELRLFHDYQECITWCKGKELEYSDNTA
ncbi:hypothetical protein L4C34_13560 [Vibrio profundum]|uniref:hypothetical protein n=1 Tax=Vibrio profundum TaxID=2910247 RepID=UPI003D0E0250